MKNPISQAAQAAADWWTRQLKRGVTPKVADPFLRELIKTKRKNIIPSEMTIDKFNKILYKRICKELKSFGILLLETKELPQGILAECAKEAGIFYHLQNPFLSDATMQVTQNAVISDVDNKKGLVFRLPKAEEGLSK